MKTIWGLWSPALLSNLSLLLPPDILQFTLVSGSQFTFDINSFYSIFSDLKASLSTPDSLASLLSTLLSFTSNLLKSSNTVYLVNHHYIAVFHVLILQSYVIISYYITLCPFNLISVIPSTDSSNPLRKCSFFFPYYNNF